MELIDRRWLLMQINRQYNCLICEQKDPKECDGKGCVLKGIERIINRQDCIRLDEPKLGQWKEIVSPFIKCSVCGQIEVATTQKDFEKLRTCRKCGTLMEACNVGK